MTSSLNAKIYRLNSGHFQVAFVNPVTMKRKRSRFLTEKEAKAYKESIERHYLHRNFSQFTEMYVGHLIEQHLEECPGSRLIERKNCFLSFCEHFSHQKLKNVSTVSLRAWFEKLQHENDYSDKTLLSVKSQVNCFFRYLVEKGLLDSSPLAQIKFKRNPVPKRPRVVLSVEEVLEILQNAEKFSPKVLYPYLACVAHTGARREEIGNLDRADVDFKTGLIHLKKTKNGRERYVRISPSLKVILEAQLKSHEHDFVFLSELGKKFNSGWELTKLITKFKAYFPVDKNDWNCHSLRHSFAYNFLKQGGEMYQLQAILGHRSIDVTVDLYGQLKAQDVESPSPYEPIKQRTSDARISS